MIHQIFFLSRRIFRTERAVCVKMQMTLHIFRMINFYPLFVVVHPSFAAPLDTQFVFIVCTHKNQKKKIHCVAQQQNRSLKNCFFFRWAFVCWCCWPPICALWLMVGVVQFLTSISKLFIIIGPRSAAHWCRDDEIQLIGNRQLTKCSMVFVCEQKKKSEPVPTTYTRNL